MNIPTWDETFFGLCDTVAKRSKDENTKLGAVIVGPDKEVRSTGYNSFPRGINDCVLARQIPPYKYFWFEHAERNAIYNAARMGQCLKGCIMYAPFIPCADCARAIIQSGIVEVVVKTLSIPEKWKSWKESMDAATMMFKEAKIKLREA